MELGLVVDLLGAEVVDHVVVAVLLVQELLDLVEGVSVKGFKIFCRKSHRDDSVADVGQVQVVAIFDVAKLLLAHQGLQMVCHHADQTTDT